MTTQNIPQDIANATKMLQTDVGLTHQIVHGDETTEVPTEGGLVPTHAKVAEDGKQWIQDKVSSTIGSIEEHADYVDGKTVEADQHADRSGVEADRSKSEADRAKEISGLDTVEDALRLAAVPAPDFHLPLISDLRIQQGFGEPDQIDISPEQDGSAMVNLPSRSAQFIRASKKIITDKAGVLQEVLFDETIAGREGLSAEGVSTNYIFNNNDPGSWVPSLNVEISDAGKYGTINLAKVLPTGSGTKRPFSVLAYNVSGSGSATLSVYAMPSSYNELRFRFSSNSVFFADTVIDIEKEEKIGGGSLPFKITHLSNGLKRVEVTYTPAPDNIDRLENLRGEVWLYVDGRADSEPDGESFFLLGLPQFEGLPFASSPIETGSSPVTRSPDIPTFQVDNNIPVGTDKTYFIRVSSNGVYLPRGTGTANSRRQIVTFGDTQNSEKGYHSIFIYPDSSRLKNVVSVFDSSNADLLASNPIDDESFSIVYRRKGNVGTLFINGVKHSEREFKGHHLTEGTVTIGGLYGGRHLYGSVQSVKSWFLALTDEQASALGKA